MAVAKDPRRDVDALAGGAFHGPAAAVDLRRDVLNLDPQLGVFSGEARVQVSPMREDRSVRLARSAGVLLHPTSLPSGRLDSDAYRFVDWLAAAGQSWWQMLPLGPPDEFGSPYASPSAFAGSPALLAKPTARVTAAEIEDFVARHPYWTGAWASFAGEDAIADQVRFEREWGALRAYAAERGVRLSAIYATRWTHASTRKLQRPVRRPRTRRSRGSFPCGMSGASVQRVAPGAAVADGRAERLVPVAEDPRRDSNGARRRCA